MDRHTHLSSKGPVFVLLTTLCGSNYSMLACWNALVSIRAAHLPVHSERMWKKNRNWGIHFYVLFTFYNSQLLFSSPSPFPAVPEVVWWSFLLWSTPLVWPFHPGHSQSPPSSPLESTILDIKKGTMKYGFHCAWWDGLVVKFKLIHTGRSSVESHSRYSATWTIWFIIRSSS